MKRAIKQLEHKCTICRAKFYRLDVFENHMTVCTDFVISREKPYQCINCSAKFEQSLQAVVHEQKCCRVYRCLSCSDFFYHLSSLDSHMGEKHPYICKECDKRFTHARMLIKHQENHDRQNKKHAPRYRLKCYLCKTIPSFEHISEFAKHRKGLHSPPYRCCFCPQTFVDIQVYDTHIEPHIDSRDQCQCPFCLRIFSPITTLERHMEIHASRFPCEYCFHTFDEQSVLTEHTEREHKGFTPYKCVACEETFPSRSDLTTHKIMNHMGDKQYPCFKCGLSFCQALELNDHMKVHKDATTTHKCKYCSQSFNEKTHLTEHTKSSHTGEQHKCVTCEKSFMHICDLITHQKTHMARNMYKCFKCSLSFSHALELNQHMKVHKHSKCVNKHSKSVNSLQIMQPGSLGQNIILIKPELYSDMNNHCNTPDLNSGCGLDVLVTPKQNTDEIIMMIKPDYDLDTIPDIAVDNVKTDFDLVITPDISAHSIKPNYDLDNVPNITIHNIKPDYDL